MHKVLNSYLCRYCRQYFISLILLLFPITMAANTANARPSLKLPDFYKRYEKYSSDTLIKMGNQFLLELDKPDSAMVCYSVISNRYKENLPAHEKDMCALAMGNMGYIYLFIYNDHNRAYNQLLTAREVSQEVGSLSVAAPSICLNLGCLYSSQQMYNQAMNLYRESLNHGAELKNWRAVMLAFLDIAGDVSEQLQPEDINFFRSLNIPDTIPMIDYVLQYCNGLDSMAAGGYTGAIQEFQDNFSLIDDNSYDANRLRCMTNISIAYCYEKLQQFKSAIDYMEQAWDIAHANDMKDMEVDILRNISKLYGLSGNAQLCKDYHLRHLIAKDSLYNYQEMATIKDSHFVYQLERVNNQILEINNHRERQALWLLLAVIVIIAIIIILAVFVWKNRQLNERISLLYDKNMELIASSVTAPATTVSAATLITPAESETPVAGDDNMPNDEKYHKSHLSETEIDQLLERIIQVVENSDIIFADDFCIDRLAIEVDSKSKYVSQVINQKLSTNFSSYISSLRVKEACRRLSDLEHYGNYTIEAIYTGLGFKSRTSFVSAFRRVTGLTPSEFQREAVNRSNK